MTHDPIAASRTAMHDQMWLRLIQLAREHRLLLRTYYNAAMGASLWVRDESGGYITSFGGATMDDTIEHVLSEVTAKFASVHIGETRLG